MEDIWSLVENHKADSPTQYKKWLDVNSGHFFYIDDTQASYAEQRKIAYKQIEIQQETGNQLLYLSSGHYIKKGEEVIPLFLSAIYPNISRADKKVEWHPYSALYVLNSAFSKQEVVLALSEIPSWIKSNTLVQLADVLEQSPAIYFNTNTKHYIQQDLAKLKSRKEFSQAMRDIFHDNIKLPSTHSEASYLDFTHILPLDSSQANAMALAKQSSMVISGPPGTGKSQTIIQLAFEEIISGKKVAVLAQKKAALDVVENRWTGLMLSDFALVLKNDKSEDAIYNGIEQALEKILQYKANSIEDSFNNSYYRHCIRTLEDYFNASKAQSNIVPNTSAIEFRHDIFRCIYPNSQWMRVSLADIQKDFIELQSLFLSLNIEWKELDFNFIHQLAKPIQVLKNLDTKALPKLLKAKKGRKQVLSIEKTIKLHLAKKPDTTTPLEAISIEKIHYLLDVYQQKISIPIVFNRRAKAVLEDIEQIIPQWKHKNIWDRIQDLKNAIYYYLWNKEYQHLLHCLALENKTFDTTIPLEVLIYIENKLTAKVPEWVFAQSYWFGNSSLEKTINTWLNIIGLIEKYTMNNANFGKINCYDFIHNFSFDVAIDIDKMRWQELCGRAFSSFEAWQKYLNHNDTTQHEPILKNYTPREIVQIAQYVRRNYSNFSSYNLSHKLNNYYADKQAELFRIIQSRKQELKEQKNNWKTAINFIQKKWSKRRKKPSLYTYIQSLDTDFLLWLKPFTIATLEEFSHLVPLQKELYDTIIIDESSQVEWLDSLPAIYRAKKIIVVGDSKQLSPTRFFRNLYENELSYSYESLLELAEEKLPIDSLKLHYRSQSRQLIDFSNRFFYHNQLRTTQYIDKKAIEWHYMSNAIYHQRKNELEAHKLLERLFQILPQAFTNRQSIGVICFSLQQKEMIESELEKMASKNNLWNEYLKLIPLNESFFVKSIEQVQGDERDIIFISSGYGKNIDGRLYQFFGPILSFKGENRLNVLMSRARKKIVFFTSIQAQDIRVNTNASQGLILFKQLLEFLAAPKAYSNSQAPAYRTFWEYYLHPFRR